MRLGNLKHITYLQLLIHLTSFNIKGFAACTPLIDTSAKEEQIYNAVYKNISAYQITYGIHRQIDMQRSGFLVDKSPVYFFERDLPNKGYVLDLQITKLDWEYPVKGYQVYQIKYNGLRYKSLFKGQTLSFPTTYDGPDSPTGYFLVCLKDDDIKFVSGRFFLHDIFKDFQLNGKDPSSYIDYLRFKSFLYKTTAIKYVKTKRGKFYYTAYSEEMHYDLSLVLDPKNPSQVLFSKKDAANVK